MGIAGLIRYAATLGLVLTTAPSWATDRLSKEEARAVAATPEDVANSVEIHDDSLDTVIRISTQPFFQTHVNIMTSTGGDKFARALIDKKTGKTIFQIYVTTTYQRDWQFFDRVNYETAEGPVSTEVTKIAQNVLDCPRYGACIHSEDFAFEVPEATLRDIAKGAAAGTDASWRFKVFGRGSEETTGMLKTELAGLLIAVDRKRASAGLPVK
jgi:hypothetical protein